MDEHDDDAEITEDDVKVAMILFDRLDRKGDGCIRPEDIRFLFKRQSREKDSEEKETVDVDVLKLAKDAIDGVNEKGELDVAVEGKMRFPEFLRMLALSGISFDRLRG